MLCSRVFKYRAVGVIFLYTDTKISHCVSLLAVMGKRKIHDVPGPSKHRRYHADLSHPTAAVADVLFHKRAREYSTECRHQCLHGATKRRCMREETPDRTEHLETEIMRLKGEKENLRQFLLQHVQRLQAENTELRRHLQHMLGMHDSPSGMLTTSQIVQVR